jgi:leader peptidase (prepilin peptidase)/N-methyltransferase
VTAYDWYPICVGFALGAAIGSFLNVVIYRLPLGQSIVRPGSHCPRCQKAISWYDNIPILSYAMLGGRCRSCRSRISPKYPAVELLTATAAAGIVWRYGPSLEAAWIFAFVATMIAITAIDWAHQIIPDPLSLGGVVLGWIGAAVCLDLGLVQSLIGSLVGAGVILVIAALYKAFRKVDGMGGGDVKLMAMIGAFLGWKMVFPVLFIAALFGSLYGVYLMRAGRGGKTAVAFGSFLAPAACVMMFAGEKILDLYLGLARP